MGAIDTLANSVFRDHVTAGSPASGEHRPVLRDIRSLFGTVQTELDLIASIVVADNIHIAGSAPPSNLNHANGTFAIVLSGDPDDDGKVYLKSGSSGSGSWGYVTQILTNPTVLDERITVVEDFGSVNYLINEAYAENTVDETRITADTFTDKTTRKRGDVFVLQMQEDNLGPVTELTINAFAVAPAYTAEGDPLKPGDIRSGQETFFYWTGSHFRVLSDASALLLRRAINPRDSDRLLVASAVENVSVELDPGGALRAAAIDAGSVAGVPSGSIRRQAQAILDDLPRSVGLHAYGQSNALGNKATPAISVQRSGYNLRMANGGVRAYEYPGTDSERWNSLVAHVENDNISTDNERGETATRGWGESFLELAATQHGLRHWSRETMCIASANGQGSTRIDQLVRGTAPYESFMKDIEFAAREADDLGLQHVIPSVWLDQIEGDVDDETAPTTWKTRMRDFATELQEDIVDRLYGSLGGPAPLIVMKQMATWNHYSKTWALAVAQLELVEEVSSKFLLVPSYAVPYPDGVHTTAEFQQGYFGVQNGWLTKMLAICGKTQSQLRPMAIIDNEIVGSEVYLEFRTTDEAEVVFDTERVRYIPNFGLQLFQSDGTTPVAITKVYLQPKGVILRTTGSSPAAGMKVRNGCNDTVGTGSGWAAGPRSNIRSTRGDEVQVRTSQGVRRVDEWSAIQQYTLT